MTRELFQMALNITEPWYVTDSKFDVESKRLDIYIDFKAGSTFEYIDTKTITIYLPRHHINSNIFVITHFQSL